MQPSWKFLFHGHVLLNATWKRRQNGPMMCPSEVPDWWLDSGPIGSTGSTLKILKFFPPISAKFQGSCQAFQRNSAITYLLFEPSALEPLHLEEDTLDDAQRIQLHWKPAFLHPQVVSR